MLHDIPIGLLQESPDNPRTHYDPAKLAELADSIREQGVIEPLVARPMDGAYEVVAGTRRLRAGLAAGLSLLPVLVRDTLTRAQALELMIVENDQREDLHPLDEGTGFQKLMALDSGYTPEVIAAKIGLSKSYVYQRLKLLTLEPTVREAFKENRITAGHAILISRLSPKDQARALEACFDTLWGNEDPPPCMSVRELDKWIEDEVRLNVRAPETAEVFPELAEAVSAAETENRTLLELTRGCYSVDETPKKGQPAPLPQPKWHEIRSKKDRCAHVQSGVIVQGQGRAQVIEICATKGCEKHWPTPERSSASPAGKRGKKQVEDWRAREARLALEKKQWMAFVPRAIAALAKKTKGLKLDKRVMAIVLDAIKTYSNGRRISQAIKAHVGAVTVGTFPQAVVIASAVEEDTFYHPRQFITMARTFGVDVAKLQRAFATEQKVAAKATKPSVRRSKRHRKAARSAA